MSRKTFSLAAIASAALVSATLSAPAEARGPKPFFLEHTSSFFLQENVRPGEEREPTAAEIIAFSRNKKQLVYTDGFTRRLGIVDGKRDQPRLRRGRADAAVAESVGEPAGEVGDP